VFQILEVGDELVVVDANHPLAGKHLEVAVEVLSIREATHQEREHGHAHGDGEVSTPPVS
jgi:FKBP-type peptidyl-prolyl cis-trans isomerase SlyD